MELKQLLLGIDYKVLQGDINQKINGIAYDSREVRPNFLFICIKGFKTDGHKYIKEAINNGASAILIQDNLSDMPEMTVIQTIDTRKALSKVANNFYNHPSAKLNLIGITGTNGKTTISHLIKAILEEEEKERPVGIIGTLYAKVGNIQKELRHTTPEALEIEEFLDSAFQAHAKYVVMEVSSHALDLYRVDSLDFNSVIFSNLTPEHLDYHNNMDNYRNAKLKLFNMLKPEKDKVSIINVDDINSQSFIEASNGRVITYGINELADVRATDLNIDAKGTSFIVKYDKKIFSIQLKMVGIFNVYNALAAIAYALGEGIEINIIKKALADIAGVPGRFELVDLGQEFLVIVDYAHTSDSLENILKTAREITQKRLITVFGCGGDRDKSKRPLMGEIAASYSDFCVITSDNPRTEDPQNIIDDIVPGLNKVEKSRYAIVVDRREAIKHALYLAKKGDVLVIAGKGHETYQILGDQVIDFDDRQVVEELLRELK